MSSRELRIERESAPCPVCGVPGTPIYQGGRPAGWWCRTRWCSVGHYDADDAPAAVATTHHA